MYRNFIIIFLACTVIPVFAIAGNSNENIEVEFIPASKEDMDNVNPEKIGPEDVKALLRFAGFEFELTKEWDDRLVYGLKSANQQSSVRMAKHQIKNFPLEALVFYGAIGASMARTAYTDSLLKGGRADPRWMENLLHEITSPVGLFSFFTFVIFSGQTNVLYSKWLTTNVGPFKKGPLKGLKISRPFRAWLEPSLVDNRLGYLRNQAIVSGSNRRSVHYSGARLGRGLLASFGGQLGMAVGMLASNVVHEIDAIISFSPHFESCMGHLKNDVTFNSSDNDANSAFHCGLFFDELGSTARSWAPGLASLISASLLSHQLVNMAVGAGGLGARGIGIAANKTISSGFLKGAIIRSNVRLPITSLARGATWLVPVPGFRVARGGLKVVGALLMPALKWFGGRRNSLLFRFVNLYAFMETDALITTPFFNWLWTDNMKAGDVSDSISDFMKYHDVDHTTPICNNPDESECSEYHDMLFSAHQTGLRFDRWRQYKIQMPMMAYHNWFKYVSNAMSSVEETYNMYRNFFLAKKGISPFNKVKYLNIDFDNLPEDFFKRMVSIIDEYLEKNENTDENEIDLNVVSLSPSRFTKSELALRNRDEIILLRALFSAHDSRVSLAPFYGDDWETAKKENRKQVLDSYLNPRKLIKSYFDTLEKGFTYFRESLASIQERYDALSDQDRQSLQKQLKLETVEEVTIQNFRKFLFKIFFSTMIIETKGFMNINIGEGEQLKEHIVKSVLPDEFDLPEDANFLHYLKQAYVQVNKKFEHRSEEEPFLAWYFFGWRTLFAAMNIYADDPSNIASNEAMETFLTFIWKDIVVPIRDETLDKLSIDYRKIDDNLRKRVLAAGIEYLKETVELELEAREGSINVINSYYIENKLGKSRDEIPKEAFWVYQRLLNLREVLSDQLTENVVLAKLHEQMFINVSNENSKPDYVQVVPRPQGMHLVEAKNNLYQIKEEHFEIEYHPSTLERIRTSYMTDFIVASAICGPDYRMQGDEAFRRKVVEVLDAEDSISVFESTFSEEDIDDIMDSIPVFDRSFFGTDYSFRPPRIVTMDEEAREKICHGLYSGNTNRIIENIYDGRFPVGDKEYSSLLHLVLDHVGLEEVSSIEEFDVWWFGVMSPYMLLFQLAADREYKRVVETGFLEPFFNDDIEEEGVNSTLLTRSSNQPVLDQVLFLSKGWFQQERRGRGTIGSYPLHYSFALPAGTFHNMYFELLYWSDMILHFVERRENSISDEQLSSLKENLLKFTESFEPSGNCSSEHSFSEMSIYCQAWAKSFLSNVKELEETVLTKIMILLDIDKSRLMQTTYPEEIKIEGLSQEQVDNVRKVKNIYIGSFFCDNGNADIYKCEPTSLPQQFLNYSMIRFGKILKEATNYMIHIGNISEHRDVLSVTTSN